MLPFARVHWGWWHGPVMSPDIKKCHNACFAGFVPDETLGSPLPKASEEGLGIPCARAQLGPDPSSHLVLSACVAHMMTSQGHADACQ